MGLASATADLTQVRADLVFDADRNGFVEWQTEAGYVYRIARSLDLAAPGIGTVADSVFFPDLIYGGGGAQIFPAFDALAQNAPPPGPVDQLPRFLFFVTAFDNGSAVVRWTSENGLPVAHYQADFDLRDAGSGDVVTGFAHATVQPPGGVPGWKLAAFVSSGPFDANYTGLSAPAEEAAVLARISGRHSEILTALQSGAGGSSSADDFSDRQNTGREFYRVYQQEYDSDNDGLWDRNRARKRDHWIPQRRSVLLNHLRSNNRNLAPATQQ